MARVVRTDIERRGFDVRNILTMKAVGLSE